MQNDKTRILAKTSLPTQVEPEEDAPLGEPAEASKASAEAGLSPRHEQALSGEDHTRILRGSPAISSVQPPGGEKSGTAGNSNPAFMDRGQEEPSQPASWEGARSEAGIKKLVSANTGGATGAPVGSTQPGSHDRPLQLGDTLKGRFYLEEIIAEGGMGVVFKARDEIETTGGVSDAFVAIKMLGKNFKPHPDAWKALLSETKKTKNLAHPNIIKVFDFDFDPFWDEYFMTMEYLQGESLEKVLRDNHGHPVESSFAYFIIEGIGRALEYAHTQKLVHSDMKPSNVFVTRDPLVKVLDFGIARVIRHSDSQSDKTVFGVESLNAYTVAYASCEIMEGWPPAPCDDVYALACIAYKLLSGRHPFGSDGERYGARFARDAGRIPDPIPGLTKRQWRGLTRGLAFTRKDRTATVGEFLDDLLPRKVSPWLKIAATGGTLAILGFTALTAYLMHTGEEAKPETPRLAAPPQVPEPPAASKPEPLPPPAKPEPPATEKTAEQQLIELIPSLNRLPVSLSKPKYREKEPIKLAVDLPNAGNLHVFFFQPGAPGVLIFPNALTPGNRVAQGVKRIGKLLAQKPYGKSWFIAVAETSASNLYQRYAKDKARVSQGLVVLPAEELLAFLREHVDDPQAVIGHAEMTVCSASGVCD